MRKHEKLLFAQLLDEENAVLAAVERVYQRALEAINERIRLLQADDLMQSRVYRVQQQEAL